MSNQTDRRAALAARLRRGREAVSTGIAPRQPDAEIPLTFGQEQLWFIDQLDPGHPTYNIAGSFQIDGPLDPAALGRALDRLVARHEALRTRLVTTEASHPVQVVDPPAPGRWDTVELQPDGIQDFIVAEATRPFSLSAGPLFRARLGRLNADRHLLVVSVHHTVFDGWSMGVLVKEVTGLYQEEVTGEPAGLPDLTIQYGDYAVWEHDRLQGQALDDLVGYWRSQLDGVVPVELPTDRPRPLLEEHDGSVVRLQLDPGLLEGLKAISSQEGTTLFVTLLAAFQVLLHRHARQDDIVTGILSANRTRPDLAALIGYLVNTLPVRSDLSGDPTFTEVVAQVRDTTVAAYTHQDLPFAKMVDALGVDRDPSRAPLAQVLFLHWDNEETAVGAGGVDFTVYDGHVDPGTAKVDLTFGVGTSANEFEVLAQYATALFDQATMERFLGHFQVLLEGVVKDPSRRLSELPLLTEQELYQEIVAWNDTDRDYDTACIHERFEAQVRATPDGIAAEFDDDRVTFQEVNSLANRIARRLREQGVGPEVLVGISMEPSLRRFAVLLGILKAGGAYVPIDPNLPNERLAYMVTDASMPVVLCDEAGERGLPPTAANLIPVDREWEELSRWDDTDPHYPVSPTNVAYVIYTSGSTGRPKGVMVEHGHVINFVTGMIEHWSIGPGDRVLQFAALSFDVSVMDIFVSLLSGATAVVGARETLYSPPRLAELIRRDVTIMGFTASVLALLKGEQFPKLRVLIPAGEPMSIDVAKEWVRPGLHFCNAYGPTETVVISQWSELDGTILPPPIGLPMPNYQCYVLDEHCHPVPVGVIGELHIGGASVARGYLNQPELSSARFIPDPFRSEPGARLYKSGDLVRRLPDGQIVFVGRADHQVKIHGLRVELGEIETAMAAYAGVAQTVVTVVHDRAGEPLLAGYARSEPGHDVDPEELRRHLVEWLPGYMVPTHLVVMEEFPFTPNGKIDRKALPAPGDSGAVSTYVAPTTLLETLVVDTYVGLLKLDRVGIDDSFFEIGGNSLQAMQLVARLRADLGVDLGVSEVFLAPTPRALAVRIESTDPQTGDAAPGELVVELAGTDAEPPLFLVHAVGGTVHGYLPLAERLGGRFHVYGIEAAGQVEGSQPAESMEAMAARYVDEIRSVQPDGPYHLGGWSMGGLVAFETAVLLEAVGQQVETVVLLDAPFAIPAADPDRNDAELAADYVADAARTTGLPADELPVRGTPVAEQLQWLAGRFGEAGAEPDAELQRRFDLFRSHRRLMDGYRPTAAVRADAVVVGAARSFNVSHQAQWPAAFEGRVAQTSFDSDHYGFLRPPLVADVAAYVTSSLPAGTERTS
jgi:amino acid adenylation domain-containing protein